MKQRMTVMPRVWGMLIDRKDVPLVYLFCFMAQKPVPTFNYERVLRGTSKQ